MGDGLKVVKLNVVPLNFDLPLRGTLREQPSTV